MVRNLWLLSLNMVDLLMIINDIHDMTVSAIIVIASFCNLFSYCLLICSDI